MTRLLYAADLHVGARLLTLEEQEAALDQVVAIAERERVDVVVIAGDDAHPLRNPSTQLIAILGRFYAKLAGFDVVIVRGNHSADLVDVEQHYRGRIHAPRGAEVLRLTGVDVAVLPFLPDAFVRARHAGELTKTEIASRLTQYAAEFIESLASQRRAGVPLVFAGHATVLGSKTSTGFDMTNLALETWHLSAEDLAARFDFSGVGHIHKHQALAANVVIPGSVQPVDFSETDQHGVVLVEVGVKNELLQPVAALWKFIPIEGLPDVRTWDIPESELANLEGNAEDWPVRPGAKLRVRIICSEEYAREYPPSRIEAALRERGASLVQVELTLEGGDRGRDAGMTDDLSPDGALARWVETADIDDETRVRILARGAEAIAAVTDQQHTAVASVELVGIEAKDFIGVSAADITLDGDGIYAITGPVGHGKSTIGADAPRFALYGASRFGARAVDQLVHWDAAGAMAGVRLRSGEHEYRIVRKLKVGSSGRVSGSLDVLERNGADWHPLSDGKLASGQAVIDELLAGLDDETLTASSILVQRDRASLTQARPEQRKSILGRAAGLGVFEQLADVSRDRGRLADRSLATLHAAAEPLRGRALTIPQLEEGLRGAEQMRAEVEGTIATLEERVTVLTDQLELLAGKTTEYARIKGELMRANADLERIAAELAEWDRRKVAADRILAGRAELEQAKADLDRTREQIVIIEAQVIDDMDAVNLRHAAIARRQSLEQRLSTAKQIRGQESRGLDRMIDEARTRGQLIDDALCCAPEPSCLFLVDARKAVAGIPALEVKVAAHAEPSQAELDLAREMLAIVIPEAPDPAINKGRLTRLRARAAELEKAVAVAEKIARAEQIVTDHATAIEKLQAERTAYRGRAEQLVAEADVAARAVEDYATVKRERSAATENLAAERRALQEIVVVSIGRTAGRLESAREAAAELGAVEAKITAAAADVTAWDELVSAWRDCRVAVLENAVIPAVERTANEVLSRFPYGLQLALRTQRDRKSGDGTAETLDVDVLGGPKDRSYEGCSGGQQTVLDFALHVAIALVVSRRSGARIRFMFIDEPAFLDEPGYAAFAEVVRWIHDAFGLAVLVSTHVESLIAGLAASEFVVSPGEHGSTVSIR